jgi:hypothetical protein
MLCKCMLCKTIRCVVCRRGFYSQWGLRHRLLAKFTKTTNLPVYINPPAGLVGERGIGIA